MNPVNEQYDPEPRHEGKLRLSDPYVPASGMVFWKYDRRRRLLSAFNSPLNEYNRGINLSVEDYLAAVHPDDRNTLTEAVRLMDCGSDISYECDIRMKASRDGEWEYFTLGGTTFARDEDGKAAEYIGFRRNTTRWKRLNDELKKVNEQNELILNNINSGLAYITPDYVVQWENISLCSTTLSSGAYRRGETCYSSAYGRTAPCDDCAMQRAARSRLIEHDVFERAGRTFEVTATPVVREDGKTDGVVVRLDDITERQRMISELRIAREEAVRSDKLKSAFLANMSHEIRTPLNAIVGFANLLVSSDSPEEKAEYDKIIAANNQLLLRLIDDILNLSKIEAGFLDRKPERFDLASYFEELYSSVKNRMAADTPVELICDRPYSRCMVYMDKNRLAQVMLNYATNAIKYTARGFIRMGYEYADGGIRLYVSDSGIGIADDKKDRVYRRFEKLDEFAQGTGLGLSICKALTEASGGRVGFESEEGVGSTFWSWIPCEAGFSEESGVPETDSREGVKIPETAGNRTENPGRKSILVAEDIESNFKLLSAILHRQYELTWALNGAEAVEKARSQRFDLILMDIKMPVMSGMEATARIREFDAAVPIIALTAHAFDSDKEAALAAGCNAYLSKPVNRKQLLETLEKWL